MMCNHSSANRRKVERWALGTYAGRKQVGLLGLRSRLWFRASALKAV